MNMTRKELISACKAAAKNCNKAINDSAKSEALKIREQSKNTLTVIRDFQAKAIARIRAETAELLAAERAQAKFKLAEVKGYKEQRKNQVKLFTGLFDTESIDRLTEAVEFSGVVVAKTVSDMQAELKAERERPKRSYSEIIALRKKEADASHAELCARLEIAKKEQNAEFERVKAYYVSIDPEVAIPDELVEESDSGPHGTSSVAETEEEDWSFEWTDQQLRTNVVLDDPRGVYKHSDNVFMHLVEETGWFDLSCNDRLRLIGLTLDQYRDLDYDRKQEVDNIVEDHRAPSMKDLDRCGFTYLCEFEEYAPLP